MGIRGIKMGATRKLVTIKTQPTAIENYRLYGFYYLYLVYIYTKNEP